jgi:thiamine-monophosphate kinase
MKTLADIGEDALVRRITGRLHSDKSVLIGPGDDCAVVQGPARGQALVLKTDTIVEGVHFTFDTPARLVGRKAVARVLSDFAAMAATPRHALVTLIAPVSTQLKRILDLYQGMEKIAREHGVRIVGGETSRGDQLILTISMSGTLPHRCRLTRAAASAGDFIAVTGRLGGSIRGRHLKFQPRLKEAQWLAQNARINAMMDISDGLAKDLPRLADASGLGFELQHAALPRSPGCTIAQTLNDGEDYELLLTLPARTAEKTAAAFNRSFPKVRMTLIGRMLANVDQRNLDPGGGWDHFLK